MMDFLRRLAPRRDGDTSWAVPVVPSRFSGMRPLSVERGAPDTAPAVAADIARAPRPTDVRSPAPAPLTQRPADRLAPTALPVVPDVPQIRAAQPVPQDRRHQPLTDERVAQPVVTGRDAEPIVTRPVISTSVERRPDVRVETPVVDVRPTRTAVLTHPIAQVTQATAPLSPAAVAERRATSSRVPAVVHVTIDRIEVRAPQAARPAARAPRARASAATVSLTEYLRGPRNQGGAT